MEQSRSRNDPLVLVRVAAESFYRYYQTRGLTPYAVRRFRNIICRFHDQHGRHDLPWRNTDDPYRILVSEIMLQQTQVERVLHKYQLFLNHFPDMRLLARAKLRTLYQVWRGMGYNRRALALRNIARIIINPPHNGVFPSDPRELMRLPFVGQSTAGAISAFAFHRPVPFIETNIRRVYIHFFLRDQRNVPDSDIQPLVEKTIDRRDPRNWYYALMDYGSALREIEENPNRRSAAYRKQGRFSGSRRQARGNILRLLAEHTSLSLYDLSERLDMPYGKTAELTDILCKEGFIKKSGDTLSMK